MTMPEFESTSIKTESKYKIVDEIQSKVYLKEFNREGKLIKFTHYNQENVSKISEFEYEDGVKVEKVTKFDGSDSHEEIIEYYHNEDGNIGEILKTDPSGNVIENAIYEYDDFGRVIKKQDLSNNSDSINILIYDYLTDSDGRINSITVFDEENKTVRSDSLIYKTDEIVRISFNPKGDVESKTIVNYDRAGNLEQELIFDSNNQITRKYVYSYTFFQ